MEEKIKKLLALAARAGTEGEAAAAMARIQSIVAKYNLDLEKIKGDAHSPYAYHQYNVLRSYPWERLIWSGVAKLYFCTFFYTKLKNRTVNCVVGESSNAAVVKAVAEYLCELARKLSEESFDALGGDPKEFKQSFKMGFSGRVYDRAVELAEAPQTTDETGTSIILHPLYSKNENELKTFLTNDGLKLRSKKTSFRVGNEEAYAEGERQGQLAPLSKDLL